VPIWGPWRSRPFRYVWVGESLSMVGDASYQIVFVWLVLSISRSPAVLAAVVVGTSVPRAVLLLLGGAVTDRVSARTVMLSSHLVRGVALAILTALAHTGLRVWELASIGVLFGVGDAFFGPASGSILPSLVEESDLPRANALVGVSEQAASFIGPVLGGALLAATSSSVALALNAVTFFLAALTILTAPRTDRSRAHRTSVAALLSEMRGGISYATRKVEVRVVVLLVSAGR
jgi:MFS family permease